MPDRCPPPCGKWRYPEEYLAILACIQHAQAGRARGWYRPPECGCWHLYTVTEHKHNGARYRFVARFLPGGQ